MTIEEEEENLGKKFESLLRYNGHNYDDCYNPAKNLSGFRISRKEKEGKKKVGAFESYHTNRTVSPQPA
eukprot:1344644-Amorphochlora_amoeboformis.AAC.1